jgi:dethiobiotin synthetase
MSVLFVTGTDTGVGKTVTTAALVARAKAAGGSAYVIKPAQTGVGPEEAGDLEEVRRLAGPVPTAEGVRLREPLAPDTAARLEGTTLPAIEEQRDLVLRGNATADPVLVEGSGGILVPLGDGWGLLDLAAELAATGAQVEFVVVARAGLGTLNHSMLTVDAIRARDLPVAGIVIGSWPERPDLAMRENLHDLPRLTGVPVIGSIPEGAGRLDTTAFLAAAPGWLAAQGE